MRLTGTLAREKASMIILRRKFNYSINELSAFFGRSRSLIHRTLKLNCKLSVEALKNLRKLPNQTRLKSALAHRVSMGYWVSLWEGFILGTEGKPP